MLHKIRPPDCGKKFEHILAFQQQVLAFACNSTTQLPLTLDTVLAEFNESGDWLWKRLWIQRGENKGNKSPLHAALEQLIAYLQARPAKRASVLEAYKHDVVFQGHLSDDHFRFKYRVLDEATRKAVGPLMIAFYEDLLCDGFPEDVHHEGGRFDRDMVLEAFWDANHDLNVCPACDGQRPDSIGAKNYSDLDHYFPKGNGQYPFLSVHPVNLVPVCKECNSSFKGRKDPIENHSDAPLLNVFIPYHRPAVECTEVRTNRPGNCSPLEFRFEDKDGMPSRRVSSLNHTFRVEERWASRQGQVVESIVDELLGARRLMQRFGANPDDASLRSGLEDMLERKQERIGKGYNYLLYTSYLRFSLGDDAEFSELLAKFKGE